MDGVPRYNPSTPSVNTLDGQQYQETAQGVSTIRVVHESPRRLPLPSPVREEPHPEQRRMNGKPAQLVRFEDFPTPLTIHSTSTVPLPLPLPQRAHVQSIRSAALDSLLPVAASQGIARPIVLSDNRRTSVRPPSVQPPDVRSHRPGADVCCHRAKRYTAPHTIQEHKVLAQQIAQMHPVDGAIDLQVAPTDLCWKCAAKNGWSLVEHLVLCCGQCGGKGNERVEAEDADMPGWNNV
jgi:hypothetical protein